MNRILRYLIGEEHAGLRISQFLRRKGYSCQNLASIRHMPDSVVLNGVPCYMNRELAGGDSLAIVLQEEKSSGNIPPVKLPLDIVYEDEDIVVVNKAVGMPTHPSFRNFENTLANGLAWYYQEQGKPFIFRCCNRLDRDTSGLTVVAKHQVSACILSSMTARREVHREYLAIAQGHVAPESGTICAPLGRKDGSIIERVVDWENGEEAITHYRVLSKNGLYSLVELELETGRTHQIRIHMKYLGYPLIGDYLYNPNMQHISRQALHSHRLSFPHPITGEPLSFTAPLPEDMRTAWQAGGQLV